MSTGERLVWGAAVIVLLVVAGVLERDRDYEADMGWRAVADLSGYIHDTRKLLKDPACHQAAERLGIL